MRDALTPPEMASISEYVGGMPTTPQGVRFAASRDGWPSRPRDASGGGREYPIATLPKLLREALMTAMAEGVPAVCDVLSAPLPVVIPASAPLVPASSGPPPALASLADWQRRSMEARCTILAEIDRLALFDGWRKAATTVAAKAKDGTLSPALMALVPVANAKAGKSGARTLSLRTLYRWQEARLSINPADATPVNPAALAPKQPAQPVPIRPWAIPLLALYRRPQKPGIPACLEDFPKHYPGVPVPSYDQARRFLNGLSAQERHKGRMGPRALLALKAFRRRDTSMLEPLDVVVADGHTFRSKWAHPITGKPFQPEVMAVIDAATRYAFGWSAGRAESTDVVMDALRHGVSTLGLFAILYTDNGSGFVNDVVSDELTGYYARLGCLHEKAEPGRAQARGLIERPNQSLWRRAAKKALTYTGRDMDREAGKRIEKLVDRDIKTLGASPLLTTWQDGLAMLADEVDAYNNRPHSALPKIRDPHTGKMRHMSPAECLQSWRDKGWEPMTVSASEADDLFRPYERRRTIRAEVTLPWGRYYHRDLEPFHGDDVLVGYDIHDGSKVWVRTLEGRLICVAARDGNLTPYQPASKVEHGRQKRAEGQIKRKQRQIDDIRVEAAGFGRVIDHEAAEPLPFELAADADALFARIAAPDPTPALPAPDADPDARPIFADDTSWAQWLVAHPDAATDADRALLNTELRRNDFRTLLELEGVDVAALLSIAARTEKAHSYA